MTSEVWKDIPGYEGRYQASNLGRVRSVPHYVRVVASGTEALRLSPGKVLRPGPTTTGHLSVALGKGNSKGVHVVVALAFLGKPPDRTEVAHLNGIPYDNRIDNLAYVSRQENIRHVLIHGGRKVSERDILNLRKLRLCKDIENYSKSIGISFSHGYAIARGKNYGYFVF